MLKRPGKSKGRRSPSPAHIAIEGDLYAPACPSRGVLEHVTSRWAVLVLVALRKDTYRYSALRRRVAGVSEKMLSQTLRALEADGFVSRAVIPEVPPRVEYSITPLGSEVADRVKGLAVWIEDNLDRILAARAQRQTKP
jgi:DNA-binding HxlR family transcriptional regulator